MNIPDFLSSNIRNTASGIEARFAEKLGENANEALSNTKAQATRLGLAFAGGEKTTYVQGDQKAKKPKDNKPEGVVVPTGGPKLSLNSETEKMGALQTAGLGMFKLDNEVNQVV